MMNYMLLLRDAANELKDLKEQSEVADANGELDEDDEYGPELDDEMRAELERAGMALMRAPRAHERVLFAPCLELYKAAMAPMRSLYGAALKDDRACDRPSPDNSPESEVRRVGRCWRFCSLSYSSFFSRCRVRNTCPTLPGSKR